MPQVLQPIMKTLTLSFLGVELLLRCCELLRLVILALSQFEQGGAGLFELLLQVETFHR